MTQNDSTKTVICLGGAGDMGKTLATHLAQSPRISRLVIADLDGEKAGAVAAELGRSATCEVTAKQVDVLDDGALGALLNGADFLANAAGPFFRLAVPVLKAAIAARVPYLDICDDPEPTIDMLALDIEAKSAGIAAVIGMGASPGLSNLMAVRAARHLDEVEDCYTAWPLDVEAPGQEAIANTEGQGIEYSAAIVHFMEQISGEIESVIGGRRRQTKPLQWVTLDFPGHGKGSALTMGHPEPITLHKSLGLTGNSANLVLATPSSAAYLRGLGSEIDTGRLSLEAAAKALTSPTRGRSMKAAALSVIAKNHGQLPAFFALLTGTRDGKGKAVGCHATTMPKGMDGATSIPAALAVDMLLKSRAEAGVHAPEDVIDADTLFEGLRRHCHDVVDSVDELVPVSEMDLAQN
jgi:saccharopine dehydrogenase-like NADP-dependent oxidoreductase